MFMSHYATEVCKCPDFIAKNINSKFVLSRTTGVFVAFPKRDALIPINLTDNLEKYSQLIG